MGRYNENEILKFLELYKRSECLWKCAHKHYRIKSKRNEAYVRIRDAMNLSSVLEVKQKIKSFRDTYASERIKVRRSAITATHHCEVYKPKLRWYNLADSFLNNTEGNARFVTVRVSQAGNTSNVASSEPQTTYSSLQVSPAHMMSNNPQCMSQLPNIHVHRNYQPNQQHFRTPIEQRSMNLQQIPTPRIKFVPLTEKPDRNLSQQNDEFYHFGMNIAMQLKSMPLIRALNVQTKIQQLLCEERVANERCRYKVVLENDQSRFERPVASGLAAENPQPQEFQEAVVSSPVIEEVDHDIKEEFIVEEETMAVA